MRLQKLSQLTSRFMASLSVRTRIVVLALIPVVGFLANGLSFMSGESEVASAFDTAERAALAWAETVTLVAETGVPDADYAAAAAVFSQQQLADLTIAIGLMNAYNRMAISFRAQPAAVTAAR